MRRARREAACPMMSDFIMRSTRNTAYRDLTAGGYANRIPARAATVSRLGYLPNQSQWRSIGSKHRSNSL